MSFRENIQKKIRVNLLAQKVSQSLIPKGDVHRVDKESMTELLETAGYRLIEIRDLKLYAPENEEVPTEIIVLDNGLATYRTDIEDVAMRKSPTLKEMVSIRNVIKILKDDDVVIGRKGETVERVRNSCLAGLDLSFTESDLEALRLDGAASLEGGYADGVIEAVEIFSELLGYQSPPKAFKLRHFTVTGEISKHTADEIVYGPVVMFDMIHKTLKMIDTPINTSDEEKVEYYRMVADDKKQAPLEGIDVFKHLKDTVVRAQLS